jgi:hypothetical protein
MSAFPYDLYKGTKTWKIVETTIHDLVENHDMQKPPPVII